MAHITLRLHGQSISVSFNKLVMAGYTGRNQAEVQAHIDELRAHGIPAPEHIPILYACSPELLTTADQITVLGGTTSGEAEFVLVPYEGEILVGVGSDQTDRKLEATDIPRAKQLCAKVMSSDTWRLADLVTHWDELILRSWIGEAGEETLYQEGSLARMMEPDSILSYLHEHTSGPADDAIVFSGTLPILGGHFRPTVRFTAELVDPTHGSRLRCSYQVSVMEYLTHEDAL